VLKGQIDIRYDSKLTSHWVDPCGSTHRASPKGT